MRLVKYRGTWAAYERVDGKPRRTSLRTHDRSEAEQRLVDLQASLKRKAETAGEIMAAYLNERGPQLHSIETATFAVRKLVPVFDHLRPDQITRPLTRAYALQRRRQGVGDGHIRRELGVLLAALRWHDKATPAVVELPPSPPPKDLCLTREQYRALRDAGRATPHLYLFVILAYTTAGRATAVLELKWNQIDFERGLIQLGAGANTSAKGRATVPMTDSARSALEEAKRAAVSDYVIEYAGRRVRSVKRAFKAAVERANLPAGISPHVLRHSAAVHMAESGVPMAEISQFLGHTSTSVTERVYARFSSQYLRKAASALE